MNVSFLGNLWSDDEKGDNLMLPRIENGLSGTSCCIKADIDTSENKLIWLGMPCNALLPALCEYKPKGSSQLT